MDKETRFTPTSRCRGSLLTSLLSSMALTSLALTAFGQQVATSTPGVSQETSESGGIAEIVVTATRREERQQDIPVSLTAFTQQNLDTLSINSVDDITRLTPGVAFVRNGTSTTGNYNDEDSDINIRGIDSTAGASTTGIYIDDTPIQSRKIGYGTQNAYPAVFDLDRVEVLRGPQGTLFGASSEGGTVRFIQPQPSVDTSSGYIKSETATIQNGDPTYELGAAAGAPLIDDVLGFRVSASLRHDGGWVDRVDYLTGQSVDPRANWHQTVTARAALTWKPSDGVSVTPSFYYQELYVNDTAAYWPILSNPAAEELKNGNAGPVNSRDPFYIAAVRVDWKLDWAQFVSDTSFYSRNQYGHSDYTELLNEIYIGSSFPAAGTGLGTAYLTDTQNNFYQEFRLQSTDLTAPVTWTAGVFYTHSNENSIENITDPTINAATGGAVCAQFPCPGGLVYAEPYDRVIDKQFAVFGEAIVRITNTLKLTGGVRVSKDTIDGSSLVGGPFLGQANIVSNGSTSETPVTPKGVLSWQPDRDNMFYVSAAKGFRPGGINSGVGNACDANLALLGIPVGADGQRNAPPSFKSDSLWSYELGAKNTLWDQRLQINSSLFYIDWKDIQQDVYLGECGLAYTANLGHVRSVGGDIAVLMRPIDPLTLNLTVAYVDGLYTETECATGTVACTGANAPAAPVVTAGDRLVGSPWNFTAAADYVFPSVFNRKPYLHMDYTYATAQTGLLPYQDSRNAVSDPTITGLPVSKSLALRSGMRWGGFDVSLFAQNVLDQHPILFDARDFASPSVQLYFNRSVQPRTIGLTATYRY
jgi:iron complex outermembrane receptor protein